MPDVEIVLEAETGREIMEAMEQTAADVIFTDIRMPDGDGLEVAGFIQKHCPDTSVAIISGYADFAYASAAIRYGVEDYLTKPVQKENFGRRWNGFFRIGKPAARQWRNVWKAGWNWKGSAI